MNGFPGDRRMSRLEEEKAETAEIREALVPKCEQAPQGPPAPFFTCDFGGVVGRAGASAGLGQWAQGGQGKVLLARGSCRWQHWKPGHKLCRRVPTWAPPLDHRAGAQDG